MSGPIIPDTRLSLPNQTGFARGSVRDIYTIGNKYLVMVVTDRISAFDVVLPVAIPYKGQVLAQIATYFLKATADIIPNWFIDSPDPNVVIGHKCQPYKIEVVVRGYLAGHAWREYKAGKRILCGVSLPAGLSENDKLPQPIITPATHAAVGHDEDISKDDIIKQGFVPKDDWEQIETIALKLFNRGSKMAAANGLILVDTKYEFGKKSGELVLIDEVHTPDSSRYYYANDYETNLSQGKPQRQLSKEFVRQWLIDHGWQGKRGQAVPAIPPAFVNQISQRYLELYRALIGKDLVKPQKADNVKGRLQANIIKSLERLHG